MGFPQNVLASDERVVLHLHPHWKTLVAPVVWFVVIIAAAVAAGYGLSTTANGASWLRYGQLIIAAVAFILICWLTLAKFVIWGATHYVFTTHRLLQRTGVFSRHGRDVPLSRVNDVSFSHTLWERMLGCGTLVVESAGENGQVVLKDLPGVEKAQSKLYQLVEDDHDRRGTGANPPPAMGPGY